MRHNSQAQTGRADARRLLLVALALVVGVLLFLKYGGAVAPVLDSKVGQ